MRIELNVSDNTPEARILSRVADPAAYLLELVRGGTKAAKGVKSAPDYLAILAQADQSPDRFQSREEIDAYIDGLRSEW